MNAQNVYVSRAADSGSAVPTGVATKFSLGWRQIYERPNPPFQQKSSDFGHFILKMLGNAKF